MKKFCMVLLIIIALAAVLTGCARGSAEVSKPKPSEGAEMFTVEGECGAALDGNILTVSGSSNLMDGTNGVISVLNSDGIMVEEHKFTQSGESVSFDFEVQDDWTDIVYGYISFSTQQGDKQPKEVTEVYGKKFENLEGENIIWDLKGVIAVFQSEAVTVR